MAAYYNEIDPFAAAWLRELIKGKHIADGEVDERSIELVRPGDLRGFDQCHFFAGIGGWSLALRLAGWPDTRSVWTGSCPCQPFSSAGAGVGGDDPRHLWPTWFRLIAECRPSVLFGEQVESAVNHGWLDLVCDDLEREGYAAGAASLPAPSVGAVHIRQRLWFVAHDEGRGLRINGSAQGASGHVDERGAACDLADSDGERGTRERLLLRPEATGWDEAEISQTAGGSEARRMGDSIGSGLEGFGRHGDYRHESGRIGADQARPVTATSGAGFWDACDWLHCTDGKARPVEPGTFPLAHGIPARVGRLRGYGNAIVPQVAAVFIESYLECVA